MKKLYLSAFLILLLPLLSKAQFNYKPGYVVTLKGDTLRGAIDYRNWDLNPDKIRFIKTGENKTTKLSVADINFFSVGRDSKYQKYVGLITMDNTDPDHMIDYRDTTYKVDSVFIRVLEKGKNIALYEYSDATKSRFYVGEAPSYTPVELGFRLYYSSSHVDVVAGIGRTVYENTYMKQLFNLAVQYNADTQRIKRDLFEYGYKEYYLKQVVKKINEGTK